MTYLDHAASTPPFPEVAQHTAELLSHPWANPSGSHSDSRAASAIVEDAREAAADALGARPSEIVFTSGGSESDNLAVKGAAWASGQNDHVVVSAIEHHAVLDAARWLESQGYPLAIARADADGVVEPDEVTRLCGRQTSIVSVMLVNNETGAIQSVREIAAAVRTVAPRALIHTDAAQAVSTMPVDFKALGVDLLTISGHKFGALQGTGALVVREGAGLTPLMHGGGQELGRRAGTSNVVGYSALGSALQMAVERREQFAADAKVLSSRLSELLEGDGQVNSVRAERVPHITSICFDGVRSEDMVLLLDREGVAVSAGSSCASGATEPSHVLLAMGIDPDVARGALRISVGRDTTTADIESAAAAIKSALVALRDGR